MILTSKLQQVVLLFCSFLYHYVTFDCKVSISDVTLLLSSAVIVLNYYDYALHLFLHSR